MFDPKEYAKRREEIRLATRAKYDAIRKMREAAIAHDTTNADYWKGIAQRWTNIIHKLYAA